MQCAYTLSESRLERKPSTGTRLKRPASYKVISYNRSNAYVLLVAEGRYVQSHRPLQPLEWAIAV
jgi:hypothetical protein